MGFLGRGEGGGEGITWRIESRKSTTTFMYEFFENKTVSFSTLLDSRHAEYPLPDESCYNILVCCLATTHLTPVREKRARRVNSCCMSFPSWTSRVRIPSPALKHNSFS